MDLYIQVSPRYAVSATSKTAESTSAIIERYWNALEDDRVDLELQLAENAEATSRLANRRAILLEKQAKVVELLAQAQKSLDAAHSVDEILTFFNDMQKFVIDSKAKDGPRLMNTEGHAATEPDPDRKRPRDETQQDDEDDEWTSRRPEKRQRTATPQACSPKKQHTPVLPEGLPALEELCPPLTQASSSAE
ncbi:hypothetical protein CALCODRAFT_517601 [Calocera cornea HHB12733]|uniref:Uncharacterized protein n=1 Tax=Calocera cornea HHB12733 TaxID=1353952 RepID=A0A165FW44_9BASI|nr:hypothetical protein CALCODRAFT_517601 [Calocera cornea HHB12733]